MMIFNINIFSVQFSFNKSVVILLACVFFLFSVNNILLNCNIDDAKFQFEIKTIIMH